MDYLSDSGAMTVIEPVSEEKNEFRIEAEIYLPDYYPDIRKVIRSEIIPRVEMKEVMSGRINIEGEAELRVIYIPADSDSIRCISVLKEFSHSFPQNDADALFDIQTETTGAILSCRAGGPRRLTVKGVVTTKITILKNSEVDVVANVPDNVEVKTENLNCMSFIGANCRELRITEELELSEGSASIANLLYTDAAVSTDDVKMVASKCVMKGTLCIKALYIGDGNTAQINTAEFKLPISQIVDIEGVDENSVCDCDFEVSAVYAEAENAADGSCRLIDCEVVIKAYARAYRRVDYTVVTDAFSPSNELDTRQATLRYITRIGSDSDTKMLKASVETEDTIAAVSTVGAVPEILRIYTDEGCLKIEGTVAAEVVYTTEQGDIASAVKQIPFTFSFPECERKALLKCSAKATVTSVSYNISDPNTVELRIELLISTVTNGEFKFNAVNKIEVGQARERRTVYPITLYFAEKDENIWEIAKNYGASMKAIMTENKLTDEILSEPVMLIIPSL